MTESINDWMIVHRYAKNQFSAQAIFNGLKLYETPRFWLRVKRVVMYRRWRDAGEPSKVAFANVLEGRAPPRELFETLS